MQHTKYLTLATLLILFLTRPTYAQYPPYPPSEIIDSIQWHYDTQFMRGKGSDQWPLTWGSDDQLYAAWGDGWGWDSLGIKRSMGVTRILGDPSNLNGHDLWGAGPGKGHAKPEALIAVGDTLWMFWTVGDSKYEDFTSLGYSYDFGETWLLDSAQFFPEFPDGFRVRGICQFGPGYQNAADGYVYVYFGFNRQADLFLARVTTAGHSAARSLRMVQRLRTSIMNPSGKGFVERTPGIL